MSLISILASLAEARVRAVLVGGVAARAHGSRRVTDDVDICYDTAADNEEILIALLHRLNAYPRDLVPGKEFELTQRYLSINSTCRFQTSQGFLDVMREVPGIGTYSDVVAFCDTISLPGGATLPLVNIEKLIRAKKQAARGKDMEAVHELRAIKALKEQAEAEGLREAGDGNSGSEGKERSKFKTDPKRNKRSR